MTVGAFYPYVVAGLPGLSFGAKPPLTFERFLSSLKGLIPDGDHALLATVPDAALGASAAAPNGTLRRWRAFETMVRNELVLIRAARKKVDPARYLREDGSPESSHAAHIAQNAYRKTSPLEGEKALDSERWRKLDDLSFGHYFDVDALVVYGAKLLILEKWERIAGADAERLLKELVP